MSDVHEAGDGNEVADGRRHFLKLGGVGVAAAAAATAAGVIGGAGRAGASSGQTITVDNAFSGTGTTQLTDSQLRVVIDNGNRVALLGQNLTSAASNPGNGVQGDGIVGVVGNTNATVGGVGVQGNGTNSGAIGVNAVNTTGGIALQAESSTGPVAQLVQTTPPAMPPSSGTWSAGMIIVQNGHVWYCYQSGAGSASKWAKLSGTFIPITPKRAYDSRGHGKLLGGHQRTISLTATGFPAGASAALLNLTVVNTQGSGYLTVYKTGTAIPNTSNINWFGTDQILANNATTAVSAAGQISIAAGGVSTDFLVDVFGFYP